MTIVGLEMSKHADESEADLGAFVREYKGSLVKTVFFASLAGVVAGMAIIVAAYVTGDLVENPHLLAAIITPFCLMGLYSAVESGRLLGERLQQFTEGFVLVQWWRKVIVRWSDIAEVNYYAAKEITMAQQYVDITLTLRFQDSAKSPLKLTWFFDLRQFSDELLAQTGRLLLPLYAEQLRTDGIAQNLSRKFIRDKLVA